MIEQTEQISAAFTCEFYDLYFIKARIRQVAICQCLARWTHTPAIQDKILAEDFLESPHVGHARRSRAVLNIGLSLEAWINCF